jgi:putative hydrolase of HD superfamily
MALKNDLKQRLEFIKEMDRLKSVERRTLLHDKSRMENTAEHSWHLATAVMVLHPFASKKIDLPAALQMAVLHDVVEIDAGDTFVYDAEALKGKVDRELVAAKRLFGLLPDEASRDFHELWLKFERQSCPESKFVSAIDRFLPIYANVNTGGFSWKKHQVTRSQVLSRNTRLKEMCPDLYEFTLELLEEAVAKGYLING